MKPGFIPLEKQAEPLKCGEHTEKAKQTRDPEKVGGDGEKSFWVRCTVYLAMHQHAAMSPDASLSEIVSIALAFG